MWGAIIAGLISIASASIQAGVSAKKGREARSEAKELAGIQRRDTLKQRKEDQKITGGQLALGRERIGLQKQQLKEKDEILKGNRSELLRGRATSALQGAGQSITKPQGSFLSRARDVERFGI